MYNFITKHITAGELFTRSDSKVRELVAVKVLHTQC